MWIVSNSVNGVVVAMRLVWVVAAVAVPALADTQSLPRIAAASLWPVHDDPGTA